MTVFLPDLDLEEMTGEMTFHTVGIHASRKRATAQVGRPLTSEPLEFERLARNIEYQASGATALL